MTADELRAHLDTAHKANLWRLAPDADHAAITAHHDADHALWRRQTGGVGHTHERASPLEQRKANK